MTSITSSCIRRSTAPDNLLLALPPLLLTTTGDRRVYRRAPPQLVRHLSACLPLSNLAPGSLHTTCPHSVGAVLRACPVVTVTPPSFPGPINFPLHFSVSHMSSLTPSQPCGSRQTSFCVAPIPPFYRHASPKYGAAFSLSRPHVFLPFADAQSCQPPGPPRKPWLREHCNSRRTTPQIH